MTKTILVKRNDWGRTRKLSRAHKSNQCRAVCGKALPQYLVGSGASIYLEFAASALKKSAPARESVGRRSSPSLSLTVPHRANPSPREQVCSRPTLGFLSDDIGSMLKGGVEVWQRQLVNEGPCLLLRSSALNLGREVATPIQRGFNASPLGRVQALKLMRPSALRHFITS